MPGPPKKPTALKLVEGTYRQDRAAKNEPKPKVAIPKPPKHMSALALEEWDRITPELHKLGLLTHIDRAALVTYCEMWANYVTASEKVKKTGGMVIQTTGGNFMDNPYFSAQKRSAELMHKFLVEFGMTPASRTRISTPLGKNDDEKDDSEEKKYFGK